MKVKLLLVAAALMVLASTSFAQFNVAVYNSTVPLTMHCNGTDLITNNDHLLIKAYWDANNATLPGPDPADVIFASTATYDVPNAIQNWDDQGLGDGLFFLPYAFGSEGGVPAVMKFYFVIETPYAFWKSSVQTFITGPNPDCDLSVWTCTPKEVTCTTSAAQSFPLNPNCVNCAQVGVADVSINPSTPLSICVGPLGTTVAAIAAGRLPHFIVTGTGTTPATGFNALWSNPSHTAQAGLWTLTLTGGQYYYCTTIATTGGCGAHLAFDYILPVEMGDVNIKALDNSVKVSWATVSEGSMLKFQVKRDGEIVKEVSVDGTMNYTYTDPVSNGVTYKYELVLVHTDLTSEVVKTESVVPSTGKAEVKSYALHQNFPNPFNPSTEIRFDLVEKRVVTLNIYNATGQLVTTLVNGERPAGVNIVTFDASRMPSGLYFYTVKAGDFSATKKMLLVK
jgi:hypothetical protein